MGRGGGGGSGGVGEGGVSEGEEGRVRVGVCGGGGVGGGGWEGRQAGYPAVVRAQQQTQDQTQDQTQQEIALPVGHLKHTRRTEAPDCRRRGLREVVKTSSGGTRENVRPER